MKTPEEILEKYSTNREYPNYMHLTNVVNAMEEYAGQLKYDFSKSCGCNPESRIGETWCCNQCGLPCNRTEKWISVKEKFPKQDEVVFVATQVGGTSQCFFDINGKWRYGINSRIIPEELIITHWMPLPEPPKK